MNPQLFALVEAHKPDRFNELITRGYTTKALSVENQMAVISTLIRDNTADFPGLEFLGLKHVTPAEEVRQSFIREKSKNKLMYDHSDTMMVRAEFSYNGFTLKPNYLKLLTPREGNHVILDNSNFYISPLLVAKGFSVSKSRIFIWMARDNVNFHSSTHTFFRDNELYAERYIHAHLHKQSKKTKESKQVQDERKISSVTIPTALYLLLERGLSDACKKYFDVDIIATNEDIDDIKEQYLPQDYVLCQSRGKKPRGIHPSRFKPSTLKLLVPRAQWNPGISGFIAGLFYLVDHFSDRMNADYLDDPRFWKPIAGHLIFNTNDHEGKLSDDIDRHLRTSVNLLLDNTTRNELKMDGYHFDTIYDLFAYVIAHGAHMLNTIEPGSMYGKRLSVIRYVLRGMMHNINKLGYSLTKLKERGDYITPVKLEDLLKRHINQGSLNDLKWRNGEVNNIQTSSDNMWWKVTSKLVPQEKNDKKNNSKGGNRGALRDESRFFHISILTHGRLCSQPKFSPDSRGELNPYLTVLPDGNLVFDEAKYGDRLRRWSREMSDKLEGDDLSDAELELMPNDDSED